jgi:hypothetical protein
MSDIGLLGFSADLMSHQRDTSVTWARDDEVAAQRLIAAASQSTCGVRASDDVSPAGLHPRFSTGMSMSVPFAMGSTMTRLHGANTESISGHCLVGRCKPNE